MIINNTN